MYNLKRYEEGIECFDKEFAVEFYNLQFFSIFDIFKLINEKSGFNR